MLWLVYRFSLYHQPPFVMDRWKLAGPDGPTLVDCVLGYTVGIQTALFFRYILNLQRHPWIRCRLLQSCPLCPGVILSKLRVNSSMHIMISMLSRNLFLSSSSFTSCRKYGAVNITLSCGVVFLPVVVAFVFLLHLCSCLHLRSYRVVVNMVR